MKHLGRRWLTHIQNCEVCRARVNEIRRGFGSVNKAIRENK